MQPRPRAETLRPDFPRVRVFMSAPFASIQAYDKAARLVYRCERMRTRFEQIACALLLDESQLDALRRRSKSPRSRFADRGAQASEAISILTTSDKERRRETRWRDSL